MLFWRLLSYFDFGGCRTSLSDEDVDDWWVYLAEILWPSPVFEEGCRAGSLELLIHFNLIEMRFF